MAVLQQKDDEELLYYLLQLVQVGAAQSQLHAGSIAWLLVTHQALSLAFAGSPQPDLQSTEARPSHTHTHTHTLTHTQALRFEAVDLSRLARFLIARATANPAFATFLHWCVCVGGWQNSWLLHIGVIGDDPGDDPAEPAEI